MGSRMVVAVTLAAILMAVVPALALAQSAIVGVVRDAQGGVLPGVTVEARSPALIEQVRATTTDENGQYRIEDLRPGVYAVTYSLAGFATLKREGIQLPANFTATINVELQVAGLEETITVAGESPVVDTRSTVKQQVLNRELLDLLPTGRNLWGTGALMTGVTLSAPDVGGTAGMQQTYMAPAGGIARDNVVQIDGLTVNGIEGDGAIQNYFDQNAFQEWSYQTSGFTADVQGAGVRLNMIPKEGGNTFHGSIFLSYTGSAMQTDNFSDALRATGMRAPNRVERIFDVNPSLGGPVVRNRLWFFASFRYWGVDQTVTDSFYNLDPTHKTYVPADGREGRPLRPVVDDNSIKNPLARLTWLVSERHKFSVYHDVKVKFRGHECPALSAEEACGVRNPKRYHTPQAKYTGTLSSQLLVEAGWAENDETYSTQEPNPRVGPKDVGKLDRTLGTRWSAPIGPFYFRAPVRYTFSASLSYVTAAHALKAGVQLGKGGNRHQRRFHSDLDLYQEYRNGVPVSVVVHNTPQEAAEKLKYDLGLYVQESWTLRRLTLSPGLRVELFNSYIPAQCSPPGRFVPYRCFDKIENYPNWKDVAPRFGAAYDVFANGKTAVKGHVGKFLRAYSTVGFAQQYNPMVFQTDRRTWTDRNGDGIAQESEIGPVNTPFNVSGMLTRRPDPDIKRPYQWVYNLAVDHELRPGLSVSAGWIRRDYRRLIWRDNVLVSRDDYTVVRIPNPLDPAELVPIYNLDPAKRGQVLEVDKNSTQNRRWYNGFDLGFSVRHARAQAFGGLHVGRQLTVWCEVEDPNALRFCDHRELDIPYLAQFKLGGSVALPWGVRLSGTWQDYPGVPTGTDRQSGGGAWMEFDASRNRVVDPSLNVDYIVDRSIVPNLTLSSVTVPLIKPGTKYLKRWRQIDLRLGREVRLAGVKVLAQLDIFNLLNASSVLNVVETYGPSLDRPTAILQGRLFAIGAQLQF